MTRERQEQDRLMILWIFLVACSAASTEDVALTKPKVLSLYYLRFIRTREFKRKLLDVLNYFRSLERKIVLNTLSTSTSQSNTTSYPLRTTEAGNRLVDSAAASRLGELCLSSLLHHSF